MALAEKKVSTAVLVHLIYMYMCVCVCMCVCERERVCVCMYVYIYVDTCILRGTFEYGRWRLQP
jgi:hypothetical protein